MGGNNPVWLEPFPHLSCAAHNGLNEDRPDAPTSNLKTPVDLRSFLDVIRKPPRRMEPAGKRDCPLPLRSNLVTSTLAKIQIAISKTSHKTFLTMCRFLRASEAILRN